MYIDGFPLHSKVQETFQAIVRNAPIPLVFNIGQWTDTYIPAISGFVEDRIEVYESTFNLTNEVGTDNPPQCISDIISYFSNTDIVNKRVIIVTPESTAFAIPETSGIIFDIIHVNIMDNPISDDSSWKQLAFNTNGNYLQANTAGDLIAAAKALVDNIRGSYTSDIQYLQEFYLFANKAVERITTATDRFTLSNLPQNHAPIVVSEYGIVDAPYGHLPSGYLPESVPWARVRYPSTFRKVQDLDITDTTVVNVDGMIDLRDENITYDPTQVWITNNTQDIGIQGYLEISGSKLWLPSGWNPGDEVTLNYRLDRSYKVEYQYIDDDYVATLVFDKTYGGLYVEYETGSTQYYQPNNIDLNPIHYDTNTGFIAISQHKDPYYLLLDTTQGRIKRDKDDRAKVIATVSDIANNRLAGQSIKFNTMIGIKFNLSAYNNNSTSLDIPLFAVLPWIPTRDSNIYIDQSDIEVSLIWGNNISLHLESTNAFTTARDITIYFNSAVANDYITILGDPLSNSYGSSIMTATTHNGQASVLVATNLPISETYKINNNDVLFTYSLAIEAIVNDLQKYIAIDLNDAYSSEEEDEGYLPFRADSSYPKRDNRNWITTLFHPTDTGSTILKAAGWIASIDMVANYYGLNNAKTLDYTGDTQAFDLLLYNASGVYIE